MSDEDFDQLFNKLVAAQRAHDETEEYERYVVFDTAILNWIKQHPEIKVSHTLDGRMISLPEHMVSTLLTVVGSTTEMIGAMINGEEIGGIVVDMELFQRVTFIAAIVTRRFILDDEKAKEN